MKKHYSYLLTFLIATVTMMQAKPAVATITQENEFWQETTAQIEVGSFSKEELKFENTVLGLLIKESGKQINDLLESNQKDLLSFSLKYDALIKMKKTEPVGKKCIIQHGLYRTLHPKLQQQFKNNTTPTSIKIRYAINHPVSIEFIINQEMIAAPALLTSTIDDQWKQVK